MAPQAYTHIVTADDIAYVKSLGFDIAANTAPYEDFVNAWFPNFDLFKLLSEINTIFTPISSGHIHKSIEFNETIPPSLQLTYYNEEYADDKIGLAFLRTFTWDNGVLVVKHDFFKLPEQSRGQGIAKHIFRESIQQYINMDVRRILVHAALKDGGYVWARNFFTALNKAEMDRILLDAQPRLTGNQMIAIKRIYDNYYTKYPAGDAFPIQKWAELPFMIDILRGSSWHGSIDLKNKEQFGNFTKYVYG